MNSLSSLACSGQLIARLAAEYILHLLKTAKGKIASRRTKSKHYFSLYLRLCGASSLTANPNDLPRLDRFEVSKAIGYQGQEVFQQDRLSTKNDNPDLSLLQILLVFKSTINGQHNVESCNLRRGQKLAVFKTSKSSVSRRLTIMAGKVLAQSFVHALVEKNPHSHFGG